MSALCLALGRRREAELHRRLEMLQDFPPGALVFSAAPVAFVDHDEVEEIGRVAREHRLALAGHEGLVDGEEDAGVLQRLAVLLAQGLRIDARDGVRREGRKGVVGLIGEDVAVSQEQDARAPHRLAREAPLGVEQLPGDLEGNGSLAGSGGERQQDASVAPRYGLQRR